MTVHASDVAVVIREALVAETMVGSVSEWRNTPNPDQGFKNRDGRYELVTIGRDCVRGFRVTIEAIPLEEAFDALD